MEKFEFYLIPDLMSWATNAVVRTPLEYHYSIDTLKSRFEELREQEYNNVPALNEQTNSHYPRLTVGIGRTDRTSQIDLIHVKNGVNYLVDDYTRIERLLADPDFLPTVKMVVDTIGVDRVHPFLKRKDMELGIERMVRGKDCHVTDWYRFHDLNSDLKFVRFPNLFGPGDLFKVRNGQQINLTYANGETYTHTCKWLDDYHVRINFRTWHILEFMEFCYKSGGYVVPVHPQVNDQIDSFKIYQVKNIRDCDYAFRGYDAAKDKLQVADYKCVYVGNHTEVLTLGKIFDLFNRDERPLSRSMHSLSVSDIVVIERDGEKQAHYVDSIGFEEVAGFAERLEEKNEPILQQENTLEI